MNVRVQDLARPDVMDQRRLEIVAGGLIDTTVVSVLRRNGTPSPRSANEGAALQVVRRQGDHLS